MAALVMAAAWAWQRHVGVGGWRGVAELGVVIALGGASYFAAAWAFGVEGLGEAVSMVRRKLGRR
jgi:hypothetical protein